MDPLTYCSGRGVGFTDFRVEANWRPPSLILEADPPDHARTRAVLDRALSASAPKALRERFAAAADDLVTRLVRRGGFDGIADLAEAYPMAVFPDAVGLPQGGREHLLPYASAVFDA